MVITFTTILQVDFFLDTGIYFKGFLSELKFNPAKFSLMVK